MKRWSIIYWRNAINSWGKHQLPLFASELPMRRASTLNRAERAERGQSLVELSLSFGILLMLLSGMLDLGRIWYIYVALEDAAGEAALYLSIDPYCEDATSTPAKPTDSCADPNNATWRAANAIGGDVIDWELVEDTSGFEIILEQDAYGNVFRDVGLEVSVELSYPITLLTPIVPRWIGINPITMTARATQTIISE
jgi:hypothetical protein